MKVLLFAALAMTLSGTACVRAASERVSSATALSVAQPNDNRVPAGRLEGGVLRVKLDALPAGWRPDLDVDSAVTVQAFAERGKAPVIPGPLLRATQGTVVRVSVRNLVPDSTLLVHGMRADAAGSDTFSVAPGETREITFTAARPGTFHYWGTTSGAPLNLRLVQMLIGAP